jgi:pimeloyl-ACP methyl ester carboxylesterase
LRRLVGLGTVACMLFAALAIFPGPASATSPPGSAPPIAWGPCSDPRLTAAHAQCGYLSVPLDHNVPNGVKIQLALARVQHTSTAAAYQGVMLTNPGGPGASGLSLATLGQSVPSHVGDAYDWIGFDPRGVGSSRPALSCVPNYFAGPRPPFVPTTAVILWQWLDRSQKYAATCGTKAPQLLAHMKTADSARDMDSIRAALGVEQISYYGISYGTYLGQVYASLFPNRIRRMVLDSSTDPRRVWYRADLDQAVAAEWDIKVWFGWLAQYDNVYHLGPTQASVERLFSQQEVALTQHPAAGVIGPDEWDDAFYGAAYTQSAWPVLGTIFSNWIHRGDPAGVVAAYKFFDTPDNDNAFAVSKAVECTDARWPRRWSTWARDYGRTYQIARFATWNTAWYSAPCLFWPVPGGRPVEITGHHVSALLVHETLDAANPFEGSLEVRARFPDSRLLAEPHGTTHAGTLFGNACVDGYIAVYLAGGVLPPRAPGRRADATCAPLPTPVPAAPAAAVAGRAPQAMAAGGRATP